MRVLSSDFGGYVCSEERGLDTNVARDALEMMKLLLCIISRPEHAYICTVVSLGWSCSIIGGGSLLIFGTVVVARVSLKLEQNRISQVAASNRRKPPDRRWREQATSKRVKISL